MKKAVLSLLIIFISGLAVNAQNWINFKNKDGAFSVHFPGKPQDLSQEVAVENEDLDRVKVYIYMYTDLGTNLNYLVAYNDFPIGYYVEDQAATYDALIEELKAKSEILLVEDVDFQGEKGKRLLLKLEKKYFTEMRVFIRGNRLYKVMLQNLDLKAKQATQNQFFSSFSFEPYSSAVLKAYSPSEDNYAFHTFQKPKKVIDDEEIDYKLYLQTLNMYQTKNTKSGGTFLFEECEFSPFYKAYSLDSFYSSFRDAHVLWNDSLLKSESVLIDGKKGMMFTIKSGQLHKKHSMLVDGNRLYFLSGYSTLLDLEGEDAKTFFTSLKVNGNYGKTTPFDLYVNKTKLLLKQMQNEDFDTRFRAKEALSFVVFDSSDVPDLCNALKRTYIDDEEEDGVRRSLLFELQSLNDASLIDFYDQLYKREGTTDAIKEQLLINMHNSSSMKKYSYFTENLYANPPAQIQFNTWNFFGIFKDSIDFGAAHFTKLQRFMSNSSYRSELLGLASSLAKSTAGSEAIKQNESSVFGYLNADVDEYIKMLKTDQYSYKSEIYSYLEILNYYKAPVHAKFLSDKIAKSKAQNWMKTEAIYVRIFNGLSVKKKVKNKLLSDIDTRYTSLLMYERMGNLNEVPKAYLTNEALAKLVIRNYFSDEEEPPSIINVLGTLEHNGKTIYVMSCSYGEAWDKYMGLVGNFVPGPVTIKSLKGYSEWTEVEVDWRAQALKMLPDFDLYAY